MTTRRIAATPIFIKVFILAKGGDFERVICKRLGLWWAERDDIFWRSSNSGGRATIRRKVGKKTVGQCGDVAATDPIGLPLLDLVTIEIKRGYPKSNFHDLLDASPGGALNPFEKFIRQSIAAHTAAGSFAWLLIHKRDRREPWVYFPSELFKELRRVGAFETIPPYCVKFRFLSKDDEPKIITVEGWHFEHFLMSITPDHVRRLGKEV